MSSERGLVVGTTADYIDWIASHYPGSALFLTDPEERRGAVEPQPPPGKEILCPLRHYQRVADLLAQVSQQYPWTPEGGPKTVPVDDACLEAIDWLKQARQAESTGLGSPEQIATEIA